VIHPFRSFMNLILNSLCWWIVRSWDYKDRLSYIGIYISMLSSFVPGIKPPWPAPSLSAPSLACWETRRLCVSAYSDLGLTGAVCCLLRDGLRMADVSRHIGAPPEGHFYYILGGVQSARWQEAGCEWVGRAIVSLMWKVTAGELMDCSKSNMIPFDKLKNYHLRPN